MNNPIEIEFAVDLDNIAGEPKTFYFLQIRPIVESDQSISIDIEEDNLEEAIVYSRSALGNGIIKDICDFVYVVPQKFNSSETRQIAEEIEKINEMMPNRKAQLYPCRSGSLGSADPWLGIPVKWSQITEARVIIEAGLENYRIDPSQGTHFFQNLTSFRVGYMTVNPYINEGFYDIDFLDKQVPSFEGKYLRVIRFEKPLAIKIDGRQNIGAIIKNV